MTATLVPQRLAWVHTEALGSVRAVEFNTNQSAVGIEAHATLQALARALAEKPELRLHIAGHSAGDEEPRLSSVRAQVGHRT